MVDIVYIEGCLDDIRNIITYYSDSIDYNEYINDLNVIVRNIDEEIKAIDDEKNLNLLISLRNRAKMYLNKVNSLQNAYIKSKREVEALDK